MSDDIQVGDKVRVVIEDTVTGIDYDGTIHLESAGAHIKADEGVPSWFHPRDGVVTSVEVIEKKVTHFRPGNFVRHRSIGTRYLVTEDGVSCLVNGRHYPRKAAWREMYLNSKYYELVELHESPL